MYAKNSKTGYTYFGARYLDSELSVWLSVDPLSDKRPWVSPYNYCQLNPINLIDPKGALDTKFENTETGEVIDVDDGNKGTEKVSNQDDWQKIKDVQKSYENLDITNIKGSTTFDMTDEFKQYLKVSADLIRNSSQTPTGQPNPFYQAEAIFFDIGAVFSSIEADYGAYLILYGKEKGKIVPYFEFAVGVSSELSGGAEVGRVDVSGDLNLFSSKDLFGERDKGFIGYNGTLFGIPLGIGGAYTQGKAQGGRTVRSFSISLSTGWSVLGPISLGYNKGSVYHR
jgi:RHS repeat-associated protein